MLDIILNLKQVRFKSFSAEPVVLTLSAKGVKEVTAHEIEASADVTVVNPEQLIATITDKKTALEMEITVEQGVGYVAVDKRQKEKLSIGKIAIDGIFTPIRGVNFNVENIRVGQHTDYNKVLLEVETDGTLSPEAAIQAASQILIEHFGIISKIELPPEETKTEKKPKKTTKKIKS